MSVDIVSRCLNEFLRLSGIDTSIFTGHSTRIASASKAKQVGLSLPEILKRGQLTNKTTFETLYNKPIQWKFCKVNRFAWVALNIWYYIDWDFTELNLPIHSTHGSMAVTISIIFRLPWQKFVEWLKFMSFNGRSSSNGWMVLENTYDLCREYIWLYRDIMEEYIDNILELCCYFKTKPVSIFFIFSYGCSFLSMELASIL